MKKLTTRDMSNAHENFLAQILEGRRSRGSGNQFNDQMDGRNDIHTPYRLAWDGKSTLGKSIGVTLEMWSKATEQAGGEIPVLALRYYTNERLTAIGADLVALSVHDFVDILHAARQWRSSRHVYDRRGQLDAEMIKDLIEQWHDGYGLHCALHEYLGMTAREFADWVTNSRKIPEHLQKQVSS